MQLHTAGKKELFIEPAGEAWSQLLTKSRLKKVADNGVGFAPAPLRSQCSERAGDSLQALLALPAVRESRSLRPTPHIPGDDRFHRLGRTDGVKRAQNLISTATPTAACQR